MSNSQSELINRFYTAFQKLDADTMEASYHPDARFDDPAFSLRGREEVGAMWRMLCSAVRERGMAEWRLEFRDIRFDNGRGFAHWEPHYRFSATGRMVHNIIDAEFEFADGLIIRHVDSFNFWRWSRQALGPVGWLLGATPILRNKVRTQAARNLARFRGSNPN